MVEVMHRVLNMKVIKAIFKLLIQSIRNSFSRESKFHFKRKKKKKESSFVFGRIDKRSAISPEGWLGEEGAIAIMRAQLSPHNNLLFFYSLCGNFRSLDG